MRLRLGAMALCCGGALLALPVASAPAATECTRTPNDALPGPGVDPPITLSPTTQSTQKQLNFDTDRDPKTLQGLAVVADKPLPQDVGSAQINFDAVLSRSGDTLESADFPDLTFTNPRISPDRQTITFAACLNPTDISAGKYVGSITVSGPAGLSAASINITVNAKDGPLFWFGLALAFLIAFALLLLKDASVAFASTQKWTEALLVPLKDLRWWAATAIALGTAFGILYAAYANDPAWGATGFTAVAALVASTFAAIGGQSVLTAFSTPRA